MSKRIGLWIDHSKAIAVELQGESIDVWRLESGIEAKHRSTGGVRSFMAFWHRSSLSSRRMEARRLEATKKFFQSLAKALGDCDELVLLGPSAMKGELGKYLDANKPRPDRIKGIITTDSRLSEAQLVAQVREFFGVAAPRHQAKLAGVPLSDSAQ